MSMPRTELAPGTTVLAQMLRRACDEPAPRAMLADVTCGSSSASAFCAGASGEVATDDPPGSPTIDYAREEPVQAARPRAFAGAHPAVPALDAQVSTFHGAGQSAAKQQGLPTSVARGILRNQPIQTYVPCERLRDYLPAEDASSGMSTAPRAGDAPAPRHTKIIDSEPLTTIVEIVPTVGRIDRRHPRIVTSTSAVSAPDTRKGQFRSVVSAYGGTGFVVGIAELLREKRRALSPGRACTAASSVNPGRRHG